MSQSETLFARAQEHIPGGVNSPVRSFAGVGGKPLFIKGGDGAYLIDADDKRYIDYIGSWGPMLHGHCHPQIINAVREAINHGLSFGAPTEDEILLADMICEFMPSIELVRMVNSGTEATMTAIRLARGFTERDKIIKFQGCYHGHSDSLLVNAGSGALTLGVPSSPGVPAAFAEHTLTAQFNDLDSVSALLEANRDQVAAIIVEPIAGNMNCILPQQDFLAGLRELCDQHQALLIFDEVMTGFRVAKGGAQQLYNITPDLTTLGKIIGGGMPVGALGGRRDVMSHLAPLGPVYQAGTLSGNPIAMAAGLATLREITANSRLYDKLHSHTQQLIQGLQDVANRAGVAMSTNYVCGMFGFFFTDAEQVSNYQQVTACNIDRFKAFFHGMLEQGIYFAPSAYEAGFISTAHQQEEISLTLSAAERVMEKL